ncbi:MAG: hypothetical protein WD295_04700, partial [Bacteroidota bacterium]
EGHLYRVDMRLRPDGSSGPLAMSRAGYRLYYEARGELWERQMLLKARVVGGHREVGHRWLRDLEPFIHPRSLAGNPREEILRVKRRIEERLEGEENIKLGSGGIRDCEFIVQALQLLNGSFHSEVRSHNTLDGIARLREKRILSAADAETLQNAYVFFRTVEHRLQLFAGTQTHVLPQRPEEFRILSKRLGWKNPTSFRRELETFRQRVRNVFLSVFESERPRKIPPKDPGDQKSLLVSQFRKGWRDARRARHVFADIRRSLPVMQDKAIAGQFLKSLKRHGAPDWGLANFVPLSGASSIRRGLEQGLRNRKLCDLLVLLASRSRRMTMTLSSEPLLFEALLGRPEEFFTPVPGWTFLRESDPSRYFHYNQFKILLSLISGNSSLEEATAQLSEFTEQSITAVLSNILHDEAGSRQGTCGLLVLGKLGGKEITAGSDLDGIFLYAKEKGMSESVAGRIANRLAEYCRNHRLPQIDYRLRPEGKNSPVAVEIGYYREYLETRASLWERQSLVKARMVYGTETFRGAVADVITRAAYLFELPGEWIQEIEQMRKRVEKERTGGRSDNLKTGRGGLMDVEFAVQSLQLRYGGRYPPVRVPGTRGAIAELRKHKVISNALASRMQRTLAFLRLLETLVRLNSEKPDFQLPENPTELQPLVAGMGFRTIPAFRRALRKVQSQNRTSFQEALAKCRQRERGGG